MQTVRRFGVAVAVGVAAALFALPTPALNAGEEVVIVVGKSQTLTVPFPLGEGTNSNPRVVRAVVDPPTRRITFFGVGTGSATYTVIDARQHAHMITYEIRVVGEDLGREQADLQKQLSDIEGVEVVIQGDEIIVQGDVATEADLNKVVALTKGKNNVENLVRLSSLAIKAIAKTIEQQIGNPNVTARPLKDKILLEGTVYSPEQKARAEAIATTFSSNVIDVIEIAQVQRPPSRAKTIVLNVHFLELSKELLDTWSVDWGTVALDGGNISAFFQQDLVNGQLVGDFNSTVSGTLTAFLPKLNRAKPEGVVRILANPVVTTKDGEPASIFTGAEVPFVTGVVNGVPTVEFKQVGINLDATPYAQGDSVDLKLKITASDVGDVDLASDQVGILESTLSCSQFTRAGESVAIGGLFRVADNILYNKQPGGSGVTSDSLFHFYLSRAYQKRKGQFIVFVTPSVYDDSVGANREMKDVFNLQEVGQ